MCKYVIIHEIQGKPIRYDLPVCGESPFIACKNNADEYIDERSPPNSVSCKPEINSHLFQVRFHIFATSVLHHKVMLLNILFAGTHFGRLVSIKTMHSVPIVSLNLIF